MVKADFTRDYYGDLGLQPGADVQDIKKQFKKLALTYHPDRNPGRESEVTAKFQMIQSAHEVLIDPQERTKYDANRIRTSYKPTYAGGTSSGMRGNPWANAGSQWAPPPKPPTARNRAPPPSAGARNYDKFKTNKPTSPQSAYEGPEARTKTYEAWERMRSHDIPKPSQSRPVPKPPPPPRNPPKPANESRKPPPKPFSNFDEYRDPMPDASQHRRSASTHTSGKKGFMPTTPGGDEPAAPKGNYFTTRPATRPLPKFDLDDDDDDWTSAAAAADPSSFTFRDSGSEEKIPNLEKRYTPYATHGGEKLDPFETANLNRSKSTREFGGRAKNVPKAPSDPNLASPRRQRTKSHPATVQIDSDSSNDESAPQMNGRAYATARTSTKRSNGKATQQQTQQATDSTATTPQFDGPLRSEPRSKKQPDPNKIFSIPVDDSTFERTKPAPNGFTSNSAENISTKFSADDWAGKFEAGAFQPNPTRKARGPQPRGRAQSTSRSRGRSPIKVSTAPKLEKPGGAQTPQESPNGTKFSAEEWSQYFKPGTTGLFGAAPNGPPRAAPSRKSTRGSVARPTMGGKAAVVDDSETPDEKPLFDSQPAGSSTPIVPSPDAMDVDTPPTTNSAPPPPPPTNTVPIFTENPTIKTSPSKRRAAPSQPQSPAENHAEAAAALKVNFSNLKIGEIISSLELPSPPAPPTLTRSDPAYHEIYKKLFAGYMHAWDEFNNRFLLHIVARKLQVDKLGSARWETEEGVEFYRRGLKEDEVVARHWSEAREGHDNAMRDYLVLAEKLKMQTEAQTQTQAQERPTKKTH